MKFSKPTIVLGVSLCCAAILLSGCESTDQAVRAAGLSGGEEAQFRKAQKKTRTQGIAVGTALGAGIGAAVGGKKGALIGAAIGAGAGGAMGEKSAKTQQNVMVRENQLDSLLAQAKAQNSALRNQLNQMQRNRNSLQSKINAAKKSGDTKALAQIRTQINSDIKGADRQLGSADSTVSKLKSSGGLQKSETRALMSTSQELRNERKLYADLLKSIDA